MHPCLMLAHVFYLVVKQIFTTIYLIVKSNLDYASENLFNFLECVVILGQLRIFHQFVLIILLPSFSYNENTGLYTDLIPLISQYRLYWNNLIDICSVSIWIQTISSLELAQFNPTASLPIFIIQSASKDIFNFSVILFLLL